MYTKVKVAELPKRTRKTESRFERTPEWLAMKADIDKGLKPKEALELKLTDAEKAEYKIKSRRTVARVVQKYLDEQGHKYDLQTFRKDDLDYIVVRCAPSSAA